MYMKDFQSKKNKVRYKYNIAVKTSEARCNMYKFSFIPTDGADIRNSYSKTRSPGFFKLNFKTILHILS